MATRKSVKPQSFRGQLCTHVAKIASFCDCGHPERAKPYAIALQKLLIDRGLLVDVPPRTGDNGPHSET